ncbi:hypothetical protein G4485_08245, partial [Blautia wexlerae]|uniref:hypothetical protein n=3 Tax=Blautia TaxID=572511 RepID=UPI002ED3F922|nr:hypothetical protein [Blautia wexlerae]NSF87563.1 hypothetical protein [Blautia wexlerae]
MSRNLYPKRNSYIKERGTIIMTKIKNTKKGMAKKTLSMSLVVAMLATSNVPVWAAEFSDGTDTAVETEAPAAETFSDDAAPVVEDTTDTTAAKATTNGTGFDITATDFTGVTNGGIVWGNKVSTTVTVTKKDDNTDNVDYYYVWKDNDGQITTEAPFSNGTVEYTPDAAQSGKDITLFVYAKKDNSVVWSWTSDSFKVQPKQLSDVINMKDDNTKLSLKSSFKKIYTGEAIVPTVDDINFANLANIKDANNNVIFTASDFVIGSTEGDTVNVTTKGVNVYLTTTKAGYAGSVVINYTISPLDLTAENVSNYLEATFVTTSKPYTGNDIVLKNTDVKIVDKKSGVDLSSYIKGEDVIYIRGEKYIKAGTQFNTGKAGDADLTFPIATPDESKYKNYTISGDLTLKPTNSFSITKRDLSTVNVSIPEQAYQNGAIVTVAPSVATYTDKTTGEVLKLAGDVVITSTATTQGVHDVTVSPATNNTNVEGSTTAKLSVAASSLSTAKFSGQSYAEQAEEYTGEQITKDLSKLGTVSITDVNGATTGTHNLVKDVDYKIEFGKNIDAGVGTVTIVGLGSYVGSTKTYTFTINPAVVDTKTVTVSKYVEKKDTTTPSDYKDAMGLVVKAKNANGKEFALTEGTDYVVEKYKFTTSDDTDTTTGEVDGKVKVVLKTTTKNGHKYLKNTNFIVKDGEDAIYSSTITKTTLKSENIKLKKTAYTYTGAAIKPDFDVVVDGRVINPTEYKIKSLTNNVNAGTATMVITGTDGTFTSKTDASITFTIEAADASKLVASVGSQTYTGYSIQPPVTAATLNNVAINVKDNFTVTYGENVAMGEGTITLTPKNGNFTGTKTITFKITGQMLENGDFKFYDANGLKIDNLSHTYDGTAYTPAKTVFDTANTKVKKYDNSNWESVGTLTEGTDYEIKYVDNTYGKKDSSGQKQYGVVLAIAKGTYGGNYTDSTTGVTNGVYTDAEGNKIENVIYAERFEIGTLTIKDSNISVANGVYAGGLPVKPVVVVNVGGKTLVEGTDYELEYGANDDRTKVTTTKSLTVKVVGKNGYRTDGTVSKNWGIDKFNLANANVTVDGDKVTVKCGRVDVETSEYTVEKKDGKVTVTAKKDSKNYTGSKTVDAATQDQKPAAPMISSVKVVGNKATAILSGDSEGAAGYDYVISTDRDCITNKDYDSVNKNQVQTSTTFKYVQQGTYYAYCHAWKRD